MDDHFHTSLKELRLQLDLMNSRTASILNKPRQQFNMLIPDSSEVDSSPSTTADNMQQIKHIGATVGTLAKHQEERFQALEHQLNGLADKLDHLTLVNDQFTPPASPDPSDCASPRSDTASNSSQNPTMSRSPRSDMAPATVSDVGGYFYPNYVQRGHSDQYFITDASSFVGRVNRVLRTKSISNIEIFLRGSALRWFHLGLRTDGTHLWDTYEDEFDIAHFCESLILLFGVPAFLEAAVSNVSLPLTSSWMRSDVIEDYVFPALESVRPQENLFAKDSGATAAVRKALTLYNQSFKPYTLSSEISDYTGYPEILDYEDLLNFFVDIRCSELEQKLNKIRSESRQGSTDAAPMKVSNKGTNGRPLTHSKVQQDSVPVSVGESVCNMSTPTAGLADLDWTNHAPQRPLAQSEFSARSVPGYVEVRVADSVANSIEPRPPGPTVESCPSTPVASCQSPSSTLNSGPQTDKLCEEPRIARATHFERVVQPMQDDATHEYTFTDVYCGGGMSSKEFTDNKTGFQSSGRATGQHPQSTHMTTISHILSSAPETGSLDTPKGADDCLAGLSFVFTGQLEHISREEVRSLVKHYGGKVTLAPSESTDYVVVGADVEPKKLASIKEHNLRVIDEHGFLNLISKLLPHDCLVPKQNKEAKSLKNTNEDVSATTITRHQEDGSSFIETSDHRPQQQISKQQQIFQAHDSFPRGSQAKAFLDDFKVFTPTKFGPNTPEYEKYQNFVMSALTRLVAMQESGVSRFQEAHGKILQLERVGQIATLDLVFARNAARDAVQNAKSKIDAIRLNNEINRRAWVDKSTPLHMRKTPITIPNYDHIESHPGTIHLTTTGKAKNEDLTSRIIDNYAIDSLWPNSRIRYSKTFLAELEQAELEFEQAQRTDN